MLVGITYDLRSDYIAQGFSDSAVGRMHDQTFAAAQITHDCIPWYGMAARGVLDRRLFAAIERDDMAEIGAFLTEMFLALQYGITLLALLGHQRCQLLGQQAGNAFSLSDLGIEIFQ